MTKNIAHIRNLVAILVVAAGFSQAAHADGGGLFVEPMVTYEAGTTNINYPAPFNSSTGYANGFGLGARVGFHIADVLFLALDGRYSMPHYHDSLPYDADATAWNWGPVLGLQMPVVGLRVWAGYVAGGELNPKGSGSVDVDFKNPTGYRVGAGFHIAIVSLNLEYQQLTYGQTVLESIGPFTSNSALNNVTLQDNAWIASVSFPLDL